MNMKGGVGKSTLAVNLAWEMVKLPWRKRVLVVDLDPQFNCSQYLLGVSRVEMLLSNNHATVWDIFEQLTAVPSKPIYQIEPSDAVVPVFNPQTSRTLGSMDLISSRLELSQSLRNPAGKEHLLERKGLEWAF